VARASGAPAIDAFLGAYNWRGRRQNARQQAAIVEGRERVAARIRELRNGYARTAVEASRGGVPTGEARAYTVADAMAELDAAFELARRHANPSAMIRVVEVRIRLYGLGVADARNSREPESMTYEQLVELLQRIKALRAETH
jgi:hypothetical protein